MCGGEFDGLDELRNIRAFHFQRGQDGRRGGFRIAVRGALKQGFGGASEDGIAEGIRRQVVVGFPEVSRFVQHQDEQFENGVFERGGARLRRRDGSGIAPDDRGRMTCAVDEAAFRDLHDGLQRHVELFGEPGVVKLARDLVFELDHPVDDVVRGGGAARGG